MIKFEVDDQARTRLQIRGDCLTLAADMCCAVNSLYSTLMDDSETDAENFKHFLAVAITSPESPLWNVSREKIRIDLSKIKKRGDA